MEKDPLDNQGVRLESEEPRYRLTLEALADVDAGRTVDQQAVEKWVDSLGTSQPPQIPSS
jgi:hypothetical protein